VARKEGLARNMWGENLTFRHISFALLTVAVLLLHCAPVRAQSAAPDAVNAQGSQQSASTVQAAGTIRGSLIDGTGAPVAGARVKLSIETDPSHTQDAESDDGGQFIFVGVTPGAFKLTVMSEGFGVQTYSGTLGTEETCVVPPIALVLETEKTEVLVSMSPIEVAQAEMKDEEKQRVLGVVPNFYVTYDPAAPPLAPKQKFELAWRATFDPVNLGLAAGVAGIEQAANQFPEFGQGGDGYAKRFGAAYADSAIGTFIGSAILPTLFKQDPRYFYKGTGTIRSRFLYAVATAVICKGDSGHWQANYSGILGGVAAAGISNLYYPSKDKNRAELTFENALIGIGSTAVANVLQEFVIRKLTPHAPKYSPASP
jgi:hypothetical protein